MPSATFAEESDSIGCRSRHSTSLHLMRILNPIAILFIQQEWQKRLREESLHVLRCQLGMVSSNKPLHPKDLVALLNPEIEENWV